MIPAPSGATRLYVIVGDPIAQVRSPAGMKDGDPLPVDVTRLAPSAYCGCVITKPEISPFIAEARKLGCVTATGTDMYQQHQGIMVDFLLGTNGGRSALD